MEHVRIDINRHTLHMLAILASTDSPIQLLASVKGTNANGFSPPQPQRVEAIQCHQPHRFKLLGTWHVGKSQPCRRLALGGFLQRYVFADLHLLK